MCASCVLPRCSLQRLCNSSPALTRALFFTFSLLLRALNSFRVINRTPSIIIRVPPFYTPFLLCDLRFIAALFTALSLVTHFYNNTSLYAIITTPFKTFLKALTIEVRNYLYASKSSPLQALIATLI